MEYEFTSESVSIGHPDKVADLISDSVATFLLSKNISNYKINIDIKSNQVKQNIIEVLTSLNSSPTKSGFEVIDTKIIFATIIELENDKLEKSQLEKIILVDVPSKIYGELRRIFVSLFENSGFKDVQISKTVDFEKLYKMRKIQ